MKPPSYYKPNTKLCWELRTLGIHVNVAPWAVKWAMAHNHWRSAYGRDYAK